MGGDHGCRNPELAELVGLRVEVVITLSSTPKGTRTSVSWTLSRKFLKCFITMFDSSSVRFCLRTNWASRQLHQALTVVAAAKRALLATLINFLWLSPFFLFSFSSFSS